jgi:site-specific DNA-methyltransferase (adenine-specific)
MVCAIEDAGLEIRDCIMWLYGSGFPKSSHAHLKPAFEPICVARKKPEGSINANAEKWGTGKYNIDACRIPYQSDADKWERSGQPGKDKFRGNCYRETLKDIDATSNGAGRFPANVIHDGIEESWARYFYCAKASPADRGEGNTHPTVKPTDLMRYLCKLVTPVGGTILDPFAGSGSTGKASALEGFEFVGIEKDPDYCKIAEGRVAGSKMERATA